MKYIDVRECISGLVLVGLGLFVALYAGTHYEMGVVRRMGPGFFPILLGWILTGLGVVVVLMSLRNVEHVLKPPRFEARPFFAVLCAVLAFALLINRIGLIPTTVILVVIASAGNTTFRPARALVLGVTLAVLAWLVFSLGLQMNLPAFELPR